MVLVDVLPRRRIGVLLALFVLSLMGLTPPPAHAAEEADALIRKGVELRKDGRDREALALFQQALERQRTARALAQLGACEHALGLWGEAEEHILEALEHKADAWIKKNEPALRDSLAFLDGKLGSIDVWGSPEGATITVDDQAVGKLPTAHPVRATAGQRTIRVEAPGHRSDSRVVDVQPRKLIREHFALAREVAPAAVKDEVTAVKTTSATLSEASDEAKPLPAVRLSTRPAQPSDAAPPREPTRTWPKPVAWSLVAGAALAAGVGIWQHSRWRSDQAGFEAIAACGADEPERGSDPRCAGLYEDLSDHRTLTFVGYGVAGGLVAGAITLFLVSSRIADPVSSGQFGRVPGRKLSSRMRQSGGGISEQILRS